MRRWGALTAAACLALMLAAPVKSATSQDAFKGQIPDLVSALVVNASTPGPAWWKVTKGDSTLWIFGAPPYIAASGWDDATLIRRVRGANAFILPLFMEPQPLRQGPKQSGTNRYLDDMDGARLRSLSPALKLRLDAVRKRWNILTIEDTSSVIFATRMINYAMLDRAKLDPDAEKTLFLQVAGQTGTLVEELPNSTLEIATAYTRGPPEPQIDCLEKTLEVAESGDNPLGASYAAWTQGDVPHALQTVGCVGVKGAAYSEEVAQLIPLLRRHLSQPGKTVAAIELVPLLMKDGVIERLTAMGYQITPPSSLSDNEADASGG